MPTRSVAGGRLVAAHRYRARQGGVQVGVVVGHRIDHEAVHRGAGHRPHVGRVGARRHQQQPDLGRVALHGQALQERHRGGIAKRVRQLLGEQQADGSGLAGAQRPRHRVRTGVAHPGGGFHHPGPQLRRQLVRAVVGVGDRGPGHPHLGGEGGQGGRRAGARRPVHACTVVGNRLRMIAGPSPADGWPCPVTRPPMDNPVPAGIPMESAFRDFLPFWRPGG